MRYGLLADIHLHEWSAFATALSNGLNSRLDILLSELKRCAEEVRNAGGDMMILAGDVFHVRGSVSPMVLNPMLDVTKEIIDSGMRVVALAGNHDLTGKESNRLGSAITALEGIGCEVVNDLDTGLKLVDGVVMIPWVPRTDDLKAAILKALESSANPSETDLILHAPIDGVIPGLPDHGLTADWLGSLGFRSVYAGHYHHHKEFEHNVFSIGALAHHTWSDVGTKAGFLIVESTGPKWFKSHAPEFVEIDASVDPSEIPLLVDGNYARVRINSTKQKDVEELRAYLTDCGARGVVILAAQREEIATRREGGAAVRAGASLEVSVTDFIKARSYANPEKLALLCNDILAEARNAE